MSSRQAPETRDRFGHFQVIPTRWGDNDVYGHVNNVVYYAWFDTAVNGFLIGQGLLDIENSPVFGVVVETRCRYFREFTYPEDVHAGLRVARLGNTSVVWEIGLFREGEDEAAALGHFVHVYVDRQTRRPVPLPDDSRRILAGLVIGE